MAATLQKTQDKLQKSGLKQQVTRYGSSLAEIVGQAPEIVGEGQAPGIVDLLKEGKYGEAGALAAFLGLDIQQLAAITTVIPGTLIKASRGAGRGLDEMLAAYQTVLSQAVHRLVAARASL